MIVYSLKNISRCVGEKKILDIESLEIEKGHIYALLGPNGSGKTTLLNIMGFLDLPSSGQIRFNEKQVIFTERALQKQRRKVVMVQQNPILFTSSVYKNLEFGLKVRKVAKNHRKNIIEESLDLVGLRHMINEPAHKLSGGETQRVVLARALALSPEVILCDEPTASVDLENQIIITKLLKDINSEKGITLVFTSHDKSQASDLPRFKLFLEQGRISVMSYENTFHAKLFSTEKRQSRCIIQNELELILPPQKEGICRLRIEPELIALSGLSSDIPNPDTITGKILRISEDVKGIRVGIDCKIHLSAILSISDYKNLGLFVGDAVAVTIPPEAVSIIDHRP